MKRVACLVLSFALLAGCRTRAAPTPEPGAETARPDAAPRPSATAGVEATWTLAPSPTPTPLPIITPITPETTATPDPNEGVGDVVYQDPLDGSSDWFWTFQTDAVAFSIAGDRLNAVVKQPTLSWFYAVGPDAVSIGDQQLRVMAIANLCYENDEYGMMFRLKGDSRQHYDMYVFKLRCGGAARVELLRREQPTVLVDWTPSPAIARGAPAENTLMVWMRADQFHFYVNDKYLFSLSDPNLAAGSYGFYVRDRTNGGLSVGFKDLVARAVASGG